MAETGCSCFVNADCHLLVLSSQWQGTGCWAGAAGQGLLDRAVDQGEREDGGRAAAHREASLGFASGTGIQPYVWVLCAKPWE